MKPLSITSILRKEHPVHELPYNPRLKQRAIKLRKARNLPEVIFWMQVTKERLHHIDFDRQRQNPIILIHKTTPSSSAEKSG